MTTIETCTLLASSVVLAVGAPAMLFHHGIAKELQHLRTHFVHAPKPSKKPKRPHRT